MAPSDTMVLVLFCVKLIALIFFIMYKHFRQDTEGTGHMDICNWKGGLQDGYYNFPGRTAFSIQLLQIMKCLLWFRDENKPNPRT